MDSGSVKSRSGCSSSDSFAGCAWANAAAGMHIHSSTASVPIAGECRLIFAPWFQWIEIRSGFDGRFDPSLSHRFDERAVIALVLFGIQTANSEIPSSKVSTRTHITGKRASRASRWTGRLLARAA